MGHGMYVLDDEHRPVEVEDVLVWGRWIQEHPTLKHVAKTELPDGKRVSTVFLGLDHAWGEGEPILFETMVFPPDSYTDLDCDRYCTWDEAVAGHAAMVERWLNGQGGYENRR